MRKTPGSGYCRPSADGLILHPENLIKNKDNMKGSKLIKGMALAALVFGAIACNDKEEAAAPVASIAGTYSGYSEASSAYFSGMYADGETATIAETADGGLSCAFVSESWGEFSFSDLAVVRDGEAYLFTASGTALMGMGETKTEYAATLAGRTDAGKEHFEIAFSMPAVMGGLTVTLRPGSAPAAEE